MQVVLEIESAWAAAQAAVDVVLAADLSGADDDALLRFVQAREVLARRLDAVAVAQTVEVDARGLAVRRGLRRRAEWPVRTRWVRGRR